MLSPSLTEILSLGKGFAALVTGVLGIRLRLEDEPRRGAGGLRGHVQPAGRRLNLPVVAREAYDDGVAVTKLHTAYLDTLAEEAVIEAQMEAAQEETHSEQISDAVGQVLAALRGAGYEPVLRLEDVRIEGGGPTPDRTPAERKAT